MVNIYFIPHQDDEILSFGMSILRQSHDNSADTYIVLCTDGSGSAIKKILNNWHRCDKHKGIHHYKLSEEAFINARDTEFIGACKALGVPESNIHISPFRVKDGNLSKGTAKKIIQNALTLFDSQTEICVNTFNPLPDSSQHKDHLNLGLAALDLFESGRFQSIKLYVDLNCQHEYFARSGRENVIEFKCETVNEKEQIKKAVSEYCLWNPREKRYAIGYHSVSDLFAKFSDNAVSYQVVSDK